MASLRRTAAVRRHRVLWTAGLAAWFALSGRGPAVAAPATPVNEYELKAAAIYNIILFTEWPASAFDAPNAPLVIAVIGRGPVADVLHQLVQTSEWRGHPVVVEQVAGALGAKRCHVLYLASSEHTAWARLRTALANTPVLTVCAWPDFARAGGIVQLGMERNRLRLTINLRALKAAGLAMSSQVLRLAEVVGD